MRIFERTFRDIRLLHVTFFIVTVLLLGVTIWMIAADHHRPWKSYQATYRSQLDPYITELQRLQKETVTQSAGDSPTQDDITIAENRSTFAESVVRLPLVDAIDPSLEIEQIIQPELTLDYKFNRVPRVDRCVTCHQGIDRTAASWPTSPRGLLPERESLELTLLLKEPEAATAGFFQPAETEATSDDNPEDEDKSSASILQRLGFALADRGMISKNDVTIATIEPRSLAARSGLQSGDVIRRIDENELTSPDSVVTMLETASKEKSIATLKVDRGIAQPYCSHSRPELFVADGSPHPMSEFGCSVCHDGQGSATSFRWAAHTPENQSQRQEWIAAHDYRPATEWLEPMLPLRLVEASCLRCHMNVTDLAGNDRRLDPAAPKLLEGFRLVRDLGCFGCHEIRGHDETGRQIGPDLRREPRYAEVAHALIRSVQLTDYQHELAQRLTVDPFDRASRKQLLDSFSDANPVAIDSDGIEPRPETLIALLKSEQTPPGEYRNVGPSLRDAARLDRHYIIEQIRDPSQYSTSPKMPQLFNMFGHLSVETAINAIDWERVEIDAISHYLIEINKGESEPTSADNENIKVDQELFDKGRERFGLAGCIACHRHDGWTGSDATIGPDLSRISEKYAPSRGETWLRARLADPLKLDPRSRMPDPRLTTEQIDQLAAWLLKPHYANQDLGQEPPPANQTRNFALAALKRRMSESDATRILDEGLTVEESDNASGDIRILTAPIDEDKIRSYVGRTSLRRRGCAACHEIPGLEDAVGIGPSLTGWGRKHPSLLAFESASEYVTSLIESQNADITPVDSVYRSTQSNLDFERMKNTDDWYFRQALAEGRREGFAWQKLRAPRSFDYKKADLEKPGDWLTMGRFDLTREQIEAIVTFVVGMVADPPETDRFLPGAKPENVTLAHGRNILERAACIRCHSARLPRWEISADPENPQPHYPMPDWSFLQPRFSPRALADSRRTDLSGSVFARLAGRPDTEPGGAIFEDETLDGEPLYFFNLWQPTAIDSTAWTSGGPQIEVAQTRIVRQHPADGGEVVATLFPILSRPSLEPGRQLVDHRTTYGRLPPTLEGEGCKVRPDWMHQYLRQPTTIRPQSVMNMPRYNLSETEIDRLVDYFELTGKQSWQKDQLQPGLEATLRQWKVSPSSADDVQRWRTMHEAMGMITSGDLDCRNCHIIGNLRPTDTNSPTLAPNLENVALRLRPEYLLRWLANPRSVMPPTAMTVNFPPPTEPTTETSSESQRRLQSVLELLIGWDQYLKRNFAVPTRAIRPTPADSATEPADR